MAYDALTYDRLRRATGEVGSSAYTDEDLDYFLDQSSGDTDAAAALVWREKASGYAEMVDITEAGSSRKNSDLFKNAISQAEYFESTTPSTEAGTFSTTRRIVRA